MKTTANWYLVRRDLEAALDHLFCLPPENFVEYDSLLSVEEFDALGYARNFPHLTCLLCALDVEHLPAFAAGDRRVDERYGPSRTSMALLPATCYKVYLERKGQSLTAPQVVGCIARCFRHEDRVTHLVDCDPKGETRVRVLHRRNPLARRIAPGLGAASALLNHAP